MEVKTKSWRNDWIVISPWNEYSYLELKHQLFYFLISFWIWYRINTLYFWSFSIDTDFIQWRRKTKIMRKELILAVHDLIQFYVNEIFFLFIFVTHFVFVVKRIQTKKRQTILFYRQFMLNKLSEKYLFDLNADKVMLKLCRWLVDSVNFN